MPLLVALYVLEVSGEEWVWTVVYVVPLAVSVQSVE